MEEIIFTVVSKGILLIILTVWVTFITMCIVKLLQGVSEKSRTVIGTILLIACGILYVFCVVPYGPTP